MKKLISHFLILTMFAGPLMAADISVSTSATAIDTTSYDGFGCTEKINSDTIIHVYRQSTTHQSDKAVLVAKNYSISAGTWSTARSVYTDATYASQECQMGVINNKLYVIFSRFNFNTQDHVDLGYIKSTDMTGTSWSSYTPITTVNVTYPNMNAGNGNFTATDTPGTYVGVFYRYSGSAHTVETYKTTDYGVTWAPDVVVYSGATAWVEPSSAYIGRSRMMMVVRNNAGGFLGYSLSSDNGATWTAIAATTVFIDNSAVKPPMIWYDKQYDDLWVAYMNRGGGVDDKIYYSYAIDPDAAFSNINTGFSTPASIDSNGYNSSCCGYPSMVRLTNSTVMLLWNKEASASDADINYAIFRDGDEGMTFK